MKIPALTDLGLVELRAGSPLVAQLLPSGAPFALRHGPTLLNQLLPDVAEDGLFRLLLRWRDAHGAVAGWRSLVGAGTSFSSTGPDSACWRTVAGEGIEITTTLRLHPQLPAWCWRVLVTNTGAGARTVDVLHAQDLGLADEGAVRNNEAYTSQYLDLLPVRDEALGWTIFSRQNQPATGGRHPWAAFACAEGAESFCTDGWQFFGADHRLTNEPAAVRGAALPSVRLQYEAACAGLQARARALPPGHTLEFCFVGRFLEDHPAASAASDLSLLREILPAQWGRVEAPQRMPAPSHRSLFLTAGWAHGDRATGADLAAWFPGARRHAEHAPDGTLLSFFTGPDTHVVTRDKETIVIRPHGHILRSGDSSWIDERQFGVSCYAAGIFGVQAYLGNPSFGRLLPVLRNALNLARAAGQRVFLRRAGEWLQLGIPSVFTMSPGEVRWLYRLGDDVISARSWCSRELPASFLELTVVQGTATEFLVSHQLLAGTAEYEHTGTATVRADDGWLSCQPAPTSLVGKQLPGTCFALAAAEASDAAAVGGDELLYSGPVPVPGGHGVFRTVAVRRTGVILLGTGDGPAALPGLIASARKEFAGGCHPALPISPRLRLSGPARPDLARIDEIIPWLNHNASIHFSAPHGLEQYGGAAWGVRDVCQGSVEWLLAIGRPDLVKQILTTVFAQQYHHDGSWPQWFMHDPYRFIQQAHSHGDVCFWPVKALCDYAEATGDLEFLATRVGYTDHEKFTVGGPGETLWEHCDRVIAHCESRFMAGTALVNYGDGDWDDTLQPADPAMRTGMTSAWTVGLAFHAFRQFAEVSRRAGQAARAAKLTALLARMRADFARRLMPGGVVAGFLLTEKDGSTRPLLHPDDRVTGIRYRLLPMTRSIIAELFTPEEARRHLDLIERELRHPDGVRLMSEPAVYHGGLEKLFKRADTAANVGREIGLQYVHAHLRYAEALAKVGDADRLWTALQVVNPVGLREVVPNAGLRQSNVYFSSSDADFADRYEAARRWDEVRRGSVTVKGGWRLYSSGPGLYLHKIRTCLLGLRESFAEIVIDPVLPRSLDGLVAEVAIAGRPVTVRYRVRDGSHTPRAVRLNGRELSHTPEANPYRTGGVRVGLDDLRTLLRGEKDCLEIDL